MSRQKNTILVLSFAVLGLLFIVLAKNKPIGDFGNYYYGSRLFKDEAKVDSLYKSIHWFNTKIHNYGEKDYFENYTSVPPLSLLAYYPFTFVGSGMAKIIFNTLSVFVFSFSLFRFLKFLKADDPKILLVAFAFIFPFYNNILQGQSYLIITALLFEIYISYQKRSFLLTAFLIAIVFHLKIFPAFILLFFLFRKEYKVVVFSLCFIVALGILCGLFVGRDILEYYINQILPRLTKNEIIDPYYSGHQSVDILLKNLFCSDALANPHPLMDLSVLALMLKGCFTGLTMNLCYAVVRKSESIEAFSLLIFFGMMLSSYITNYALILLIPFILFIVKEKRGVTILILMFIAFNIPVTYLKNFPTPFNYLRLILMLLVLMLVVIQFRNDLKWKQSVLFCVLFTGILLPLSRTEKIDYYRVQSTKGIPYNLESKNNKLIIHSCLGETDIIEEVNLNFKIRTSSKTDRSLGILINDSIMVYLSDKNQGIGMNKLHQLTLTK